MLSKYTTSIKEICESFLTQKERCLDLSVNDIIDKTKYNFFNFDFPWYTTDNKTKEEFIRAFLLRYYNDYIGFETLGMWKTYFNAKMCAIMPYYTKLYNAIRLGDTPLNNVDVTIKTNEKENKDITDKYNDTSTNKSKTDTNTQSIESDNPQVTVATNDYASNMNRGEGVTNTNGSGDFVHIGNEATERERGEENHEIGIRGKTKAELIKEYSKQIININKEIIDLCDTLFLGVW